jgi:outer membrane receptor for ferrienterochelin and colicins
MKNILKLFCITVFLWGFQNSYAQTRTITGTVYNGITNQPIPDAIIVVKGVKDTTKTTSLGEYSIKVPDTMKTITFAEFAGMEVMEIKNSNNDEINIYLSKYDLDHLSLDDLLKIKVVTASKKEQTMSQAPAIISVITAQQIEERGYQSVGEALNSVAGIYPLYDYVQYNIGIRGVNGGMDAGSRILKVMINGQSVAFRPTSESFLGEELIPVSTIERIEIIRGPASALYGANAFLGVINIITKTTNKNITGQVTGKYGKGSNLINKGGNAYINGKVNKIGYIVSGTYDFKDRSGLSPVDVPGFSKYTNDVSKNDLSKPFGLYSMLNYTDKKTGNISFDFNYQNLDSYGEFQDWGLLTHTNHIQLINYYTRLKYEKDLSEKMKVNISVAYSDGHKGPNDKLSLDTSKTNWISRKIGCKSLDITLNSEYSIKKRSNIKVGVDFTNDKQNLLTYYLNQKNSNPQPQQGKEYLDTTFINTGIFFQAIVNPAEIVNTSFLQKLDITAGVRYDIQNVYGDVFNYRLAGIYTFNKSIYTKLLYGTSYKAPSADQLFSNYITVGGVIGNPKLRPEKAKTIEWALGLRPIKGLSITTTAFYTTTNNKVELILPHGTISNVSYGNVAKINSAGMEFEVLHNFKNIMNYANFSYQRSILTKENLTKEQIQIKTELYPDMMLKFGSNMALSKYKLAFNLEGAFTSPRIASEQNNYIYDPVNFRTNRYELPSYFMLNAAISSLNVKLIKNSETRLMVKINNILNKKAAWPGFKDFDISFVGRNIMITITQKI